LNELLSALRGFFVAPAGTAAHRSRLAPPAPSVAVLGPPRELAAAGPGLALALARRGGAGVGLACTWGRGDAPRAPATRRARRLAARLEARGVRAAASGRLVCATLPDDPAEAFAAAQRAVGAAGCPAAIALCHPREPVMDDLLLLQDAIVLVRRAGDPPAVARLAESGLSGLGVPVVTCDVRVGAAGRALAAAGLAAPGALRAALAPAVEVVA
jgi:hypothetical protein